MKKVVLILLSILSFISFFSFQQKEKVNYMTIKVADLLSVKVPTEFQKLSDDQIAQLKAKWKYLHMKKIILF